MSEPLSICTLSPPKSSGISNNQKKVLTPRTPRGRNVANKVDAIEEAIKKNSEDCTLTPSNSSTSTYLTTVHLDARVDQQQNTIYQQIQQLKKENVESAIPVKFSAESFQYRLAMANLRAQMLKIKLSRLLGTVADKDYDV